MLTVSRIYTVMMLARYLGVTFSDGATDGTYEKNCRKTIITYQTVNVEHINYFKSENCSGIWFLKNKCEYTIRSRTIYNTVLRPAYIDSPVCCPNLIELNNTCVKACSYGKYGKNCKSLCNCSSDELCDPVSGMCFSDWICKQPGTSNCDDQRNTFNCSDELKDGACNQANNTVVERIRSFMTNVCNCQIKDAFCVPTNGSCYCKNGWTGHQCERSVSTDVVPSKKRFTIRYIIGGVAGGVVIIVLVVVVIVVIVIKRKHNKNGAKTTTVHELTPPSANRFYSALSPNLHKNENDNVAIKPLDSDNDVSGSKYENARGGLQYNEASGSHYEEVEYLQKSVAHDK